MAIREEEGHKAGQGKKQKGSGGDVLSGTRGNGQCARGVNTAGAGLEGSLAAAVDQGSQPGLSATKQKRKKQKHDAKHEQGQQPEAEQDKLTKKRNRNKFKQPDEGGNAADLRSKQPPVEKGKQGTQSGHEQEQQPKLEQLPMPKKRHRADSKQADEGATADWKIQQRLLMREPKCKADSGEARLEQQQQAKPELDTLRKKRNRNNSRQRDKAGQAAAYQSLQAKSPAQQALRQHSSSAQVPEVPESDHELSGKKQVAWEKQSIWEADAQGKELGVKVGKVAREQSQQHTAGKQTAIPNSLKGAWEADKHAVTQDGQLGRRHAEPGSLRAAGQSRPKQDSLLSKMRAKLSGSQFRWLNEQLYTCPGSQAFELMQEQPQLFTQYHEASPCLQSAQSLISFSGSISCACSTALTFIVHRLPSSPSSLQQPCLPKPRHWALLQGPSAPNQTYDVL